MDFAPAASASMSAARKFYITTPIYYVNARPHIGHAYTTLVCDAVARFHRMLGHDTRFLTGTDEHGQKIERSAAAAGKSPRRFVDETTAEWKALWSRMGIRYDDFLRTTEDRHRQGVHEIFRRMQQRGFIYKGSYSGQYCVFDELYVDAAPGAPCPDCGRPTETVSEENYYFRLSAFQEKLIQLYTARPDFIFPESRRNEVLSFVRGGLKDLSISRTSVKWGIPVPGDPAHVIYVWLDALSNYATAVGLGSSDPADQALFARYWPADVHIIGKEIVRFHAVYWPAFLMAAELPLPGRIVTHGWLLFEQDKMSKSRGNIVRAETILDVLGTDALRYFLLREIVFGQDGAFSFDALVQRYDADLANGLGNLCSRTLTMIQRYFQGQVPYPSAAANRSASDDAVSCLASGVIASFVTHFEAWQFSRALESAWSLVAAVNKYLVENEPWALAEKDDEESRSRLATVLYTSAESLRIVTALIYPVMPEAASRIWDQLGLRDLPSVDPNSLAWGQLQVGTALGEVRPVFPRAEKDAVERMQRMEQDRNAPPAASAAPAVAAPAPAAAAAPSHISIDDFAKVELRVGRVKVAEKIQGADKLLRLEVDLGAEVRQVLAGIALAYQPEQLVGRKVIVVTNLAPRKMRGLESNGMILAASVGDQGLPVLAGFLEDVPVGAKVK
jgi:methionyl-tRNA synthetase